MVNGGDVNIEQVRRGMAWHYKAYEREQAPAQRKEYAAVEDAAKAAGIGLWALPNPVPPWEFRRGKQSTSTSALVPAVVREPEDRLRARSELR